jgi:predicted dehydrogenase
MFSSKFNIVLSGPGLIGKKHLHLITDNPNAQLLGIVAPRNPINNKLCSIYGVPLFTDMRSALASGKTDAVIISSPNEFHFEQAMICIEMGIPILVEKPLTDKLETAFELVKAAEKFDVAVLVGHHRIYSPLLEAARVFLKSEQFGSAVTVQGSALFYKPNHYFDDGPWRSRVGGGPILINMIHEIGILRYLFGEISSVTAKISSSIRRYEVEDSAAITLSFTSGAIGTFLLSDVSASSKNWEMTTGENQDYPFFPDQNCYHFAGTMGSLDFPSMQFRTYSDKSERSWWNAFSEGQLSIDRQDPLANQLNHFIEVVTGKTTSRVSARNGYQNMLVLDAIVNAATNGCETFVAGMTR